MAANLPSMLYLKPIEIPVRDSEPLELMTRVELAYIDRFGADPEDKGGWYEPDGWRRISRVFERLVTGGDILDVGTGAGQFINCLALSGRFRSVTTIDPTRFNKYIELSNDIRRFDMSVADMRFDDASFDVVTCMEVLEHLPEEIFLPAIAELRRVCRGQLIMTVPYQEPEPISKTHVRRFEDADFARLFPHADFAILRRPRKPWMLIEEWPKRPVSRIADVDERADSSGRRKAAQAVSRAATWMGVHAHRAKARVAASLKR